MSTLCRCALWCCNAATNRRGVLFFLITASGLALTPRAHASTAKNAIPAGPVAPALVRLAADAGWQLLYTPETLAGCVTTGVPAGLPQDKALRILLEPCGLKARRLAHGMVLIERHHAPPPVEHPASPEPSGFDILVTALHHETKLQLTPIAMNVVTGAQIARAGDPTIGGLSRLMPSLALFDTGPGLQRLILRGIAGAGEPTVGVYYDETPVSGPAGTTLDAGSAAPDLETMDVDRVELVRGPQGTLFGASAMGGTLRVIFRKPELDAPSVQMSVGVSSTQRAGLGQAASAVINMPLLRDRLALRVVGYGDRAGGYIDNVTLGQTHRGSLERAGGRASLLWEPGSGLSLTATGAIQTMNVNDSQYWTVAAGTYRTDQAVHIPLRSNLWLASMTGSADLGGASVLLTGSHYDWRQERNSDYSAVIGGARTDASACQRYQNQTTACTAAQMDAYSAYVDSRLPALLHQPFAVRADSAELRLASPTHDRRWSWTVGLFYQARHDTADSYALRVDPVSGSITEPLDITGYRRISMALYQAAVFGEVTRALTGRLRATAGLRHFQYLRTAENSVPIPNVITGTADVDAVTRRTRESGQMAKFALSWQPPLGTGGDLATYVSATQGYRPGGINITPGLTADQLTYRSDSLWSYEIGAKYHPAPGRFGVDVALFHIDWSRMIFSVSSASGAFAYNTNIGSVVVNGAELALQWTAWSNGTTKGTWRGEVNWNDAHLSQDQQVVSAAGIGHRGDAVPNTPRMTASLSYTHETRLGSETTGQITLGGVYFGGFDSQFNAGMALFVRTPAHAMAQAQVSVTHGAYALTFSADNVLNSAAATRVQLVSDGSERIYGVTPRTLRLTGTLRF